MSERFEKRENLEMNGDTQKEGQEKILSSDWNYSQINKILDHSSKMLNLKILNKDIGGAHVRAQHKVIITGSCRLASGEIQPFEYTEHYYDSDYQDGRIPEDLSRHLAQLNAKATLDGVKTRSGLLETGGGRHNYYGD